MNIALIVLGCIFAGYGVTIMLASSGTLFFLVWYAIGFVLGGTGALGMIFPENAFVRFARWGVTGTAVLAVAAVGALGFHIMHTAHTAPPQNLDYLIVLGAQVKPDGTPANSLRYRLEAALEYLERNPGTRVIVSGGQGLNEPCPEAEAMAHWLEQHGIDASRIDIENESTTTAENLEFSKRYLGPEADTVGIVTNDFHVYRALRIAERQGFERVYGIAAYSIPWYAPNNLLRECLAIAKNTLTGAM